MASIFIACIIAVIVAGLAYWLISFLPVPEPFNRLAKGLIICAVVLFIIVTLWGARGQLGVH